MRLLLLILFAWSSAVLHAQQTTDVYKKKNILKEIRAYNKAANFAKVDETLRNAFGKYPQAQADAELRNYFLNAKHQLALQENRKIYLNNKPDTAKYFSYIYELYETGLTCDSLDNVPDRKGRVKPRYTSNISSKLQAFRNNLRSGGKYFYKKKQYADAYRYFDMYLSTIHNPLVSNGKADRGEAPVDVDSVEIARLSVIAAYGANKPSEALKYVPVALRDTSDSRASIYEIAAKSLLQLGDTAQYVACLHQGLNEYPLNELFYASLITYYNERTEYAHSLAILDSLVNLDVSNHLFWYLKGKVHQCMQQSDSAIAAYQHAIQLKPDDARAYSSLGSVHLEDAHRFYDAANLKLGAKNYATNRRKLNQFYFLAKDAYEHARQFDENDKSLWLDALREIYFKLNMGKELGELNN